jgi:putative redox protein
VGSFRFMSDDTFRSVDIERTSVGRYVVRNVRGGSILIGTGGDDSFTPVELLLAAIGGCTAIDVDLITSRRAEPSEFSVRVTGDKIRDEAGGNRMTNLTVEFTVTFPYGEAGDAAREVLPISVQMSHDRLCTVSRTVELGTPVSTVIVPRKS